VQCECYDKYYSLEPTKKKILYQIIYTIKITITNKKIPTTHVNAQFPVDRSLHDKSERYALMGGGGGESERGGRGRRVGAG